MSRSVSGLLLGFAAYAALSWALFAAKPAVGVVWPIWYGAFRAVTEALLAVAPGFIAGCYAGCHGFRLGAILGVLISIASVIVALFMWGRMPFETLAIALIFGTANSVITQSIGGAAGQLLRVQRPAP
jgi:hypothetical protein